MFSGAHCNIRNEGSIGLYEDRGDIMTQLNVTKDNKIQEYIKEKENPYCFFSESTKVTISFIKNGRTLEEQLLKCIVANRTI